MANIHIPGIPDIPGSLDYEMYEFLRALKETLEILTGRVGGNEDLIDYMEADDDDCPKCGA